MTNDYMFRVILQKCRNEYILDVDVLLNNNTLLNLEMQVVNEHNWTDRSLAHLCRSFDQLYHGHWQPKMTSPAISTIGPVSSRQLLGRNKYSLLKKNKTIQEASQALYELSANQLIRQKCRARENYNCRMRTIERDLEIKRQLEIAVAEKDAALAEKDNALARKDAILAKQAAELAEKDAEIARLLALSGQNK